MALTAGTPGEKRGAGAGGATGWAPESNASTPITRGVDLARTTRPQSVTLGSVYAIARPDPGQPAAAAPPRLPPGGRRGRVRATLNRASPEVRVPGIDLRGALAPAAGHPRGARRRGRGAGGGAGPLSGRAPSAPQGLRDAGGRGESDLQGRLLFTADFDGTLALVNDLPLEEYVPGAWSPGRSSPARTAGGAEGAGGDGARRVLAKIGPAASATPILLCAEQHCPDVPGESGEHRRRRGGGATRGEARSSRKGGALVASTTARSAAATPRTTRRSGRCPRDPNLRGLPDLVGTPGASSRSTRRASPGSSPSRARPGARSRARNPARLPLGEALPTAAELEARLQGPPRRPHLRPHRGRARRVGAGHAPVGERRRAGQSNPRRAQHPAPVRQPQQLDVRHPRHPQPRGEGARLVIRWRGMGPRRGDVSARGGRPRRARTRTIGPSFATTTTVRMFRRRTGARQHGSAEPYADRRGRPRSHPGSGIIDRPIGFGILPGPL